MKKILAMFLLMPSLVLANPQIKTIQTMCLNGNDLGETINEFKELPYVRGISTPFDKEDAKLSLVIFLNPTTGTFTIVEKAGNNLYCILAVGGGFEPVPKEIQDDVRKEQQEKSTL
jgi:hypothetical protein